MWLPVPGANPFSSPYMVFARPWSSQGHGDSSENRLRQTCCRGNPCGCQEELCNVLDANPFPSPYMVFARPFPVIPLKIGSGKPVVGATLVVARSKGDGANPFRPSPYVWSRRFRKAMVIPLKIGSGKPVVGATLVVARSRRQPVSIPLCGLRKATVIPLKIGSGKPVVGATLVVASSRRQPVFIPLCGLRKAMVISAKAGIQRVRSARIQWQ